MSRLRAASLAALAAAALGGWAASAADEAIASPAPAAEQTYQVYIGGPEPFGSIIVNTATHRCRFAFPLLHLSGCSLRQGETSISAWMLLPVPELGLVSLAFTVQQTSGPAAYSGHGVEVTTEIPGRTTVKRLVVELKS